MQTRNIFRDVYTGTVSLRTPGRELRTLLESSALLWLDLGDVTCAFRNLLSSVCDLTGKECVIKL